MPFKIVTVCNDSINKLNWKFILWFSIYNLNFSLTIIGFTNINQMQVDVLNREKINYWEY